MARIWESERGVPFTPETGKVYRNEGGGEYRCIDKEPSCDSCLMKNTASGWRLIAYEVQRYSDGTIDWAYSTGLGFSEPDPKPIAQAEIRSRQISLANALLCFAI